MIVSDEEEGHREEGGVHDTCCPAEDDHTELGFGERHQRHSSAVEQESSDVNSLGAGKSGRERLIW